MFPCNSILKFCWLSFLFCWFSGDTLYCKTVFFGFSYYNWQTAAPIILSHVCFDKDLPEVSKL